MTCRRMPLTHPGTSIRDSMEAMGWSVAACAQRLGDYAREPVTASEPTYRYFPRDGGVVVGTYRLKQRQVLGCADKHVAGSIGSGRHRWACCDFDNLDRLHPSGTLDQEIAQHGDCQQQHHVHGDQHPHRGVLDLIDELLQDTNLSLADATRQTLGRSVRADDLFVDDASIVIIYLRGLRQPISGRGRARPSEGDDSNRQ